jgi:hypothetical protein
MSERCCTWAMTWRLDPAEVTEGSTGYLGAPASGKGPTRHGGTPARREFALTLKHIPTGVSVTGTARGPFTRAQQKTAKERLRQELWLQLEAEVAAALRVSGR